jgi:hypothetical protein
MRRVIWEDKNGYFRAAMIRDDDPDSMGPQGVPLAPPSLDDFNCGEVMKEIHNGLVKQGLFTWADVVQSQSAVTGVVTGVIKRHLIRLYRSEDQEE